MTTTFRQDVRAGLVSLLNGFKTANPTMLGSVLPSRPEGFTGDYPIAFPDSQPESIVHDSGTRTRLMTPAVAVVAEKTLNAEEQARFDILVDTLLDYFTANPHIVTGTIWDQMTIEDYAEVIGEQYRPGVRFTFGNLSIQEGRT
jgi:hypothetical protein